MLSADGLMSLGIVCRRWGHAVASGNENLLVNQLRFEHEQFYQT